MKRLFISGIVSSCIAVVVGSCTWKKAHPTQPPTISPANVSNIPPLKIVQEPAAPEIPVGTAITSLDNIRLLHLLYGPYQTKFNGAGQVVQSADFEEGGKKKHILIANLSRAGLPPLLSAHVFVRTGAKWLVEANYTHLEIVLSHFPKSEVRWHQIGTNNFGIEEKYSEFDRERPTAAIELYAKQPVGWQRVMNVSQSVEKGETVTVDLSFVQGRQHFWEARVKTVINRDKPLTLRYVYQGSEYVPAGVVPPISIEQAMHTRGLPATDWDGIPVELPKR